MNRILLSQQSYFISVLAHVLILVVAGLYFSKEVTTVQVGNANEVLVKSYVAFNPHAITSETVAEVQQDKSTQLADKKEVVSRNEKMSSRSVFSAQSSDLSKSQQAAQRSQSASSRGESVEPLLALLHAAIQAQQHYPESALEMQREGRVRVGFVLRPNGSIEQVALVKSSGTSSLDEAGLQAVRDAAPFKGVEQYLDSARAFEIDVVFGL